MSADESIALNESRTIWWRYPRLLVLPAALTILIAYFAAVTALRAAKKAVRSAWKEVRSRSIELAEFLADVHLFALWLATGRDYLGRSQLKEREVDRRWRRTRPQWNKEDA